MAVATSFGGKAQGMADRIWEEERSSAHNKATVTRSWVRAIATGVVYQAVLSL